MPATPDRGFITWKPQEKTKVLLDQVLAILEHYHAQLPITIRQIFYRMIAAYGYEKSAESEKRFYTMMVKARRARMKTRRGALLIEIIRDDTGIKRERRFFADADDYLEDVRADVEQNFRLDRQFDQPRRLVVWAEAAGMIPQLDRIARPYGINVYSGRGYDGLTDKFKLAKLWANSLQPVTVLHIGDLDPDGVLIFEALAEDVVKFADELKPRIIARPRPIYGDIEFVRIALTPEQVSGHGLRNLGQARKREPDGVTPMNTTSTPTSPAFAATRRSTSGTPTRARPGKQKRYHPMSWRTSSGKRS
jgi:hypothetical protein